VRKKKEGTILFVCSVGNWRSKEAAELAKSEGFNYDADYTGVGSKHKHYLEEKLEEYDLIVAMSRLNRILEVDLANQIAIVEPGVITGQFQKCVAKKGLFYPPDPASKGSCFLGGNMAESSGGPKAVKYGITRDYVLNLEVVLANGKLVSASAKENPDLLWAIRGGGQGF